MCVSVCLSRSTTDLNHDKDNQLSAVLPENSREVPHQFSQYEIKTSNIIIQVRKVIFRTQGTAGAKFSLFFMKKVVHRHD